MERAGVCPALPVLRDATGREIAVPSPSQDPSPLAFLERMAREGRSLAGADLARFLSEWPGGPHVLDGGRLDGIDLRGCRANGVSARRASLVRALLSNGSFREAAFDGSRMDGVIADGANFFRASLVRCSLREVQVPSGQSQRHPLRPVRDEWVPFDRALVRSAEFSRADLRGIVAVQADFSGSDFEKAELAGAVLERCSFSGAYWKGAGLDGVVAYYCALPSPTLHLVRADGAVFRSNIYTVEPGVRELLDAGLRFPTQLRHYLRECRDQRRAMPREMRSDADRTMLIRILVTLSVPVLVALSWRKVETAPGVSAFLAFGAVSAFALRRYLTVALQGILVAALGRLHDAHGAVKAGRPIQALSILFLPGFVTDKLGFSPGSEGEPPTQGRGVPGPGAG